MILNYVKRNHILRATAVILWVAFPFLTYAQSAELNGLNVRYNHGLGLAPQVVVYPADLGATRYETRLNSTTGFTLNNSYIEVSTSYQYTPAVFVIYNGSAGNCNFATLANCISDTGAWVNYDAHVYIDAQNRCYGIGALECTDDLPITGLGFDILGSTSPATIISGVTNGVQETGQDVWPLFAILGVPVSFVIGRAVIGFIRLGL